MLYFHDTAHMTKNNKLTNIMALYNVSAVLQIIDALKQIIKMIIIDVCRNFNRRNFIMRKKII